MTIALDEALALTASCRDTARTDLAFIPPAMSIFEQSKHEWVLLGNAMEHFQSIPATIFFNRLFYAMRREPCCIDQIPGGHFLQVLCSFGDHDAYNGTFPKRAPYSSLRNA